MMKQLLTAMVVALSFVSSQAQDKLIEFLDFQLRAEAGLHGLYLPSRQNTIYFSNNSFGDTSLFNPGIHLKLTAAPIVHKNFGLSAFWERMQGYAITSDHVVKSSGFEAYLGTPNVQFVYGQQQINRQAYMNRSEYISATTVNQWIGGSVYADITRKQYGIRMLTNKRQRIDLTYFSEYWPQRNLTYTGYGFAFLGQNSWQFAAEVIPTHPVIGFNLIGSIPADIKTASLMAQLKFTKHLVYNGNYRKVWMYGP
jgi:hypothetical protein